MPRKIKLKQENRKKSSVKSTHKSFRKKITSRRKYKNKKCMFISPSLECMLGGFGTLACLDPKAHQDCEIKQKNEL